MDQVDIRLLAQLGRGFSSRGYQPAAKGVYARIAKTLGLDEDTIRRRIDKLRSTGLINGWKLFLNANTLGLQRYAITIQLDPQTHTEDAIQKIRLVHGVVSIERAVGDVIAIELFCEDEKAFRRRVGLVSELTGGKEMTTWNIDHPNARVDISPTDWEIIKALRRDPEAGYNEVAHSLGLSSRTIARRIGRLMDDEVIYFFPDFDCRRLEGALLMDLYVLYTSGSYKGTVDNSIFTKFGDYAIRAGWGSQTHGHFEFIIPGTAIAQEIVDWAKGLEGVRDVKSYLIYDWVNYYDEAVDEMIEGQAPTRPKSGNVKPSWNRSG